jgi:hypothetical protein
VANIIANVAAGLGTAFLGFGIGLALTALQHHLT